MKMILNNRKVCVMEISRKKKKNFENITTIVMSCGQQAIQPMAMEDKSIV